MVEKKRFRVNLLKTEMELRMIKRRQRLGEQGANKIKSIKFWNWDLKLKNALKRRSNKLEKILKATPYFGLNFKTSLQKKDKP